MFFLWLSWQRLLWGQLAIVYNAVVINERGKSQSSRSRGQSTVEATPQYRPTATLEMWNRKKCTAKDTVWRHGFCAQNLTRTVLVMRRCWDSHHFLHASRSPILATKKMCENACFANREGDLQNSALDRSFVIEKVCMFMPVSLHKLDIQCIHAWYKDKPFQNLRRLAPTSLDAHHTNLFHVWIAVPLTSRWG